MTKKDSAQARCFCICAAGCLASPSRQRTKKANAKKTKKQKRAGGPRLCDFFSIFPTSLRIHNRYKTSGPTSMQTWQADSKHAPGYATTEQHPAKFITISIWPVTAATTEQQPLKFIIFAMLFFACFLFLHYDFVCACQLLFTHRTFAISTGASPWFRRVVVAVDNNTGKIPKYTHNPFFPC